MCLITAGAACFFLSALWAVRDGASPCSVFFLSWSGVLGLLFLDYGMALVGYQELFLTTWLSIGLALGMVACGWLMVAQPAPRVGRACERLDLLWLPLCLLLLCALGYLLYMKKVLGLCGGRTLAGFFLRWNYEETMGELRDFGGVAGRLATLPAIALPANVYLLARGSRWRKTLIVCSLIEFVFLISPRRALILQTLVSAVFVHVYVRGLSRKMVRLMVGGGAGLVLLFASTQVALNKAGANAGLSSGLLSAYVYFSSNVPIFQQLTRSAASTGGEYVLNIPLRITNKLGMNRAPDLSIPFVKVPVEGNTAPFFYYPYRDWGLAGVVPFCWLVGLSAALAYQRRCRGAAWLLVSAFTATAMVFSVRENIFITYQFWYAIFVSFVIGKALARPGSAASGAAPAPPASPLPGPCLPAASAIEAPEVCP